jgi:Na+/citrate or Na+/malate symporter
MGEFSNALPAVLAVAILAMVVGEHIGLLNGKPADDVILFLTPTLFPPSVRL